MDNLKEQNPEEWTTLVNAAHDEAWELFKDVDESIINSVSKDEFMLKCASKGLNLSEKTLETVYDYVKKIASQTCPIYIDERR